MVQPEEVHELIRCCTEELKSRGTADDIPPRRFSSPFVLRRLRPDITDANAHHVVLQLSIFHSCFFPFVRPPIPALCAPLFDTFLIRTSLCVAMPWPRRFA
jgi:hypothetical protein